MKKCSQLLFAGIIILGTASAQNSGETEKTAGQQILEHNRQIKDLRDQLDEVQTKHGLSSKEYKELQNKLEKERKSRDEAAGSLGEDQGMRRKMRRDIANDKKAAERQRATEAAAEEAERDRNLTKKEKADIEAAKRLAEEEAVKKAEEEAKQKTAGASKSASPVPKEDAAIESDQE
ncbi:MAG: hypothetical protein COV44_04325 [Deltaproteobacteria bacterium CG11_big_fil_rev_8_21_14_0_20_45_16]|nr:MAG: hypothetical protein COV44_04325 [Deltaproteobacteria bacterium CG11_big_fil_rev_8_21_14_0_20_45_16]